MPAYLPERSEFGIKVVSVYDDNPSLDLPRITATVLVLDPVTGAPKAFMDGASLTAIRTGAGGGVQQICSLGRARKGSGYLAQVFRQGHSCKR